VSVVVMVATLITIGSGVAGSASRAERTSLKNEVAQATAAVAAAGRAPTKINQSVKLPRRPPTGKSVGWLVPGLAAASDLTGPIEAAAKQLGWKIIPIAFDESNPATINAAFQQAVSEHVNYIVPLAVPSVLFASGLASAKAAGIPVLEYATATEPNASQRGIISCYECTQFTQVIGATNADFAISDSHGHADGAYLDIPEIPSLGNIATSFAKQLTTKCSGCKGAVIMSSVNALGAGTVGTQIIAYLQAHPSVDYVGLPTDGIADNLPQLLQTAGLAGKVKVILGNAGTPQLLNDLSKGKISVALSFSDSLGMWDTMYALAANSVGVKLPAELPSQFVLWTTKSIPKPIRPWGGPSGYQKAFKVLERT
jgi:ABC-type sugar transport system substrate-binding protein